MHTVHSSFGPGRTQPRLGSHWSIRLVSLGAALAGLSFASGCQSAKTALIPQTSLPLANGPTLQDRGDNFVLGEGDVIKITFPGARDLDPADPLQIRRDGKISLPIIGEVKAVGRTPAQLQHDLIDLYAGQLQSKEVVVTVVSASFSVFVDGAVLHAGKVTANHPLTILEAVMEAGGFDYNKANIAKVMVIRKGGSADSYTYYNLNLKKVLEGKLNKPFYLAPGDMVHVPERYSWF
jgi:polysaccharide export outer membrane protein